ncbi:hypothetical protein HMPREF0766_12910 [Sphingobacterium spiritivorum ATCC 33861]|uniref:Uncharacterized protein n=1 Tax=Sphingobacterium spiritivorum ATCC 33861 TaxID=525373 RepID=D7VPJ0_SPHSI|nr:hypothetical protein HMPREF0766_12910 [Sphingobacterium spiritivorum ATCC 33861]
MKKKTSQNTINTFTATYYDKENIFKKSQITSKLSFCREGNPQIIYKIIRK